MPDSYIKKNGFLRIPIARFHFKAPKDDLE